MDLLQKTTSTGKRLRSDLDENRLVVPWIKNKTLAAHSFSELGP